MRAVGWILVTMRVARPFHSKLCPTLPSILLLPCTPGWIPPFDLLGKTARAGHTSAGSGHLLPSQGSPPDQILVAMRGVDASAHASQALSTMRRLLRASRRLEDEFAASFCWNRTRDQFRRHANELRPVHASRLRALGRRMARRLERAAHGDVEALAPVISAAYGFTGRMKHVRARVLRHPRIVDSWETRHAAQIDVKREAVPTKLPAMDRQTQRMYRKIFGLEADKLKVIPLDAEDVRQGRQLALEYKGERLKTMER